METQLVNRYAANLHGVLSCYDRILITGTIPGACYAQGMSSFLYSQSMRGRSVVGEHRAVQKDRRRAAGGHHHGGCDDRKQEVFKLD